MATSVSTTFRKDKIFTFGGMAIRGEHYLTHTNDSTMLRNAQTKMNNPEEFVDAAIILMHVVETSPLRRNQAVAGLLQLIQYNQEKNLRVLSPSDVIELCQHILPHTKESEHFHSVAKDLILEQEKRAALGQAILHLQFDPYQQDPLNISPVLKAAEALKGYPHQTQNIIEAHQAIVSFLEDALTNGARKNVVLDAQDVAQTVGTIPALASKQMVKRLNTPTIAQEIDKSIAVIIDLADSLRDSKARFESLEFATQHARDEKLKAIAMSGYIEAAVTQPMTKRIFALQNSLLCAQMGQLKKPEDSKNILRLMQTLPARTVSGTYPSQLAMTGTISRPAPV